MKNKLYSSADEALKGVVKDGQLLAVGGFGLSGNPIALIEALLAQGKAFADFHVNIMNQTVASDTYTKPGGESPELLRGRKMFDANV